MTRQQRICYLLITPMAANIIFSLLLFLNPRLGFSSALTPLFVATFVTSAVAALGGILNYTVTAKSQPSSVCLIISLISLGLNALEIVFGACVVTASLM